MKTPKQEQHGELTKDGKGKKSTLKSGLSAGESPGFAMAKAALKPNGTWSCTVKCVNGNPGKNPTCSMSRGVKYFGGREEIPNPADIAVYLPDGVNIDSNYVFPWGYTLPDPLRLGGGVVKGTLNEGAQRETAAGPIVLMAPLIKTTWVNGTPWVVNFFIHDTFGMTLYDGDVVFGLAIMDPVSGELQMRAMAKSEGDCI
jgi:hypothetical protein